MLCMNDRFTLILKENEKLKERSSFLQIQNEELEKNIIDLKEKLGDLQSQLATEQLEHGKLIDTIKALAEKNTKLETDMTDTQMALAEIFEGINSNEGGEING